MQGAGMRERQGGDRCQGCRHHMEGQALGGTSIEGRLKGRQVAESTGTRGQAGGQLAGGNMLGV